VVPSGECLDYCGKPGSKEEEEIYICETKAKKNGGIQYNTQCKKIGKKADAYLSGAKNKMGKSYKCGECPIDQE
jgi:hypothetical protein